MIKSMTGFGRGNLEVEGREYTVEIKTINHRYREVSVRLPRYLSVLEDSLRQMVAKSVSRGKIEVFVSMNDLGNSSKTIKVDVALADLYVDKMKELSERYQIENDVTVTSLMRFPDILVTGSKGEDELYEKELRACTELALEKLNASRLAEGNNLKQDVLTRLEKISTYVDEMDAMSSSLIEEYKNKLQDKLKEWEIDNIIDENRLAAEVVLFADRASICEEVTRLRSHIQTLKSLLEGEGAVGKKIDFLVQEMNRETNTIGSKANCIDITNRVIEVKNEIENIREQIQNIE